MKNRTFLRILFKKQFALNISASLKQIWVRTRQQKVTKGHVRAPMLWVRARQSRVTKGHMRTTARTGGGPACGNSILPGGRSSWRD